MKLIYLHFISILILFNYNLNAQNSFWESYSLAGRDVRQIEMDRQNNYYAVIDSDYTHSELLKSNDGISWNPVFFSDVWDLEILIDTTNNDFDLLYAVKKYNTSAYSDTLYFSTNYGNTWNVCPLPVESSTFSVRQMAFKPNGNLYLTRYGSIYFTTDNGNSWNIVPSGGYYADHFLINIQGDIYLGDIGFDPNLGYIEEIYKTDNDGATWIHEISSWGQGINFGVVESLPTGEIFAGILFGYIYLKNNPNRPWIIIDADIDPGSMVVNKYKNIFVSKNPYTGNLMPSRYSPDYGTTWFNFDNGILKIYNMVLDEQGYLYAATSTGVFRSIESTFPVTDKFAINFLQTAVNDTAFGEITIFNPFDSQLVIDSFLLSSDNFHLDKAPPFVLQPGDSELVTLFFSPDSWGTYDDTLTIYSNLKTSRIFLSGESPSPEFEIHPATPFLLFGTTYLDSTKTKTINIINHSINYLEIDSIYTHSTQFSVSSINFPVQIALDSITFVVSFAPDSNIDFVDTLFILNNLYLTPYSIQLRGKGVTPVRTLGESNDHFIFKLSNNFPNPFNPATRIKFQLAEKIHVKISVYNLLGEEISILVDGEKSAGTYEVEFDGTNLPSGVYLYRMEAGSYSDTKKLLLLK